MAHLLFYDLFTAALARTIQHNRLQVFPEIHEIEVLPPDLFVTLVSS